MQEFIVPAVAVASFALTAIAAVVAVTRSITNLETSLSGKIDRHRIEIDSEIAVLTNRVGETVAALREQMTQDKLWNREHFLRRDSFQEVMRTIGEDLKTLRADLKSSVTRIEDKIDKIQSRGE